MKTSREDLPISYTLRKWTWKEKDLVLKLRETGLGPLAIAKKTGFPIDQIRFWIYKRKKQKKTSPRINNRENCRKYYYRSKFNDWFQWKTGCIRSSLLRVKQEKEIIPTSAEIKEWLINQPQICYYCNMKLNMENYTIDHLQPTSRGGNCSFTNLRPCCKNCNRAKGAMSELEYFELLNIIQSWEDSGKKLLSRLRAATYQFGPN